MHPIDHFKVLCKPFHHVQIGDRVPVSVAELEEIFFCTRRNVILILKKLSHLGWIEWIPGVGRSKQSYLIFQKSLQELLLERIQELFKKEKIREAILLLEELDLTNEWKEEVSGWLNEKLGFHQEVFQGEHKDVLQFPYFRKLSSLDPLKAIRQTELHIIEQIYDGLLKRDANSGEVVAHIAHAWESDESATEWTFYLRKHVLFHDGRELTSQDVRYTLQRLNKAGVWMYTGLHTIVCVDRYTIRLAFSDACPLLPRYLANPQSVIQREDLLDKPIGTGPFRLIAQHSELIEFHAFDQYFAGRPLLDVVRMWILPSFFNESLHQRSDIQFFPFLPSGREEIHQWNQVSRIDLERKVLICHTKKRGFMQDSQVREAVAQSIDSNQLIKELGENRYKSCETLYTEVDKRQADFHDQNLIENIPLTLYTNDTSLNVADAEWLADFLGRKHIALDVVTVPIHDLVQKSVWDKADLILFSMVNLCDRELSYLQFLFGHDGAVLQMFEDELSKQIKALGKEASLEKNPSKILHQIDKLLIDSTSVIPLYKTSQHAFVHPAARGAELDDFGFLQYQKCWFR
ncbi:ABC transporter substrate-binding protein [Alkalicoccobacillus plakortidis]|uniref:ABC transporter substrate-binding protein n=1 Tax=Alkalicoccobacillus plakortidis TaxID=444060 RepID=A0ABT0XPX7_9BACI|nr:ABC transporter substrate-binding protein [Alkalicoccobacillus plakortidis]MCM2677294.1 ABC transporter substrate-binding protein [Alkalicoccobacillus plakortidis]